MDYIVQKDTKTQEYGSENNITQSQVLKILFQNNLRSNCCNQKPKTCQKREFYKCSAFYCLQ